MSNQLILKMNRSMKLNTHHLPVLAELYEAIEVLSRLSLYSEDRELNP